MYIPSVPQQPTRRQVPLQEYLRELPRRAAPTLSDIALDRPWLRGGGLLLVALAVAGLGLGVTGLPFLGYGLRGGLLGLVAIPAVGAVAFVIVSLVYHGMARVLEGEGGYLELVSAMIFASLPVVFLGPAALLRLLPGAWGGLTFFVACVGLGVWVIRLVYLAVRESHRFTGTQAILTMMVPITMAFLIAFMGMFLTAMGILIFG